MGEHFEGANAEELQADLDAARDAGNMETVRYLEFVQADRKQKKAIVESHDIVLGNPDAYSKQTVAAQKEFAADRKVDKVKFEDLGLRGTEVAEDTAPTAPRSAAAKADTATKTESK
jgi:hypothetical protein